MGLAGRILNIGYFLSFKRQLEERLGQGSSKMRCLLLHVTMRQQQVQEESGQREAAITCTSGLCELFGKA